MARLDALGVYSKYPALRLEVALGSSGTAAVMRIIPSGS